MTPAPPVNFFFIRIAGTDTHPPCPPPPPPLGVRCHTCSSETKAPVSYYATSAVSNNTAPKTYIFIYFYAYRVGPSSRSKVVSDARAPRRVFVYASRVRRTETGVVVVVVDVDKGRCVSRATARCHRRVAAAAAAAAVAAVAAATRARHVRVRTRSRVMYTHVRYTSPPRASRVPVSPPTVPPARVSRGSRISAVRTAGSCARVRARSVYERCAYIVCSDGGARYRFTPKRWLDEGARFSGVREPDTFPPPPGETSR